MNYNAFYVLNYLYKIIIYIEFYFYNDKIVAYTLFIL